MWAELLQYKFGFLNHPSDAQAITAFFVFYIILYINVSLPFHGWFIFHDQWQSKLHALSIFLIYSGTSVQNNNTVWRFLIYTLFIKLQITRGPRDTDGSYSHR